MATPSAPVTADQPPFAFGDFTRLNGTPLNQDVVFDSPFFIPDVRFDTHYIEDLFGGGEGEATIAVHRMGTVIR